MLTREDLVMQSIQDFVKSGLQATGYGAAQVREEWPTDQERGTPLTATQVAAGYNFDDGGTRAELGSELIRRVYTVELWVFGATLTWGRNTANVIRALLEDEGMVSLKDYAVTGAPEIDKLVLLDQRGVTVQRNISPDPKPWDRFVFTTTARFEDFYLPVNVI